MVNIGDIVVQTQEETFRLGLLTVRQMATMQNALGARMASDCIEDGKALGMGHDSLLEASQYVQTIEHRQGLKVACLEEIAYQHKWIDRDQLLQRADALGKTGYGQYLFKLAGEDA